MGFRWVLNSSRAPALDSFQQSVRIPISVKLGHLFTVLTSFYFWIIDMSLVGFRAENGSLCIIQVSCGYRLHARLVNLCFGVLVGGKFHHFTHNSLLLERSWTSDLYLWWTFERAPMISVHHKVQQPKSWMAAWTSACVLPADQTNCMLFAQLFSVCIVFIFLLLHLKWSQWLTHRPGKEWELNPKLCVCVLLLFYITYSHTSEQQMFFRVL